MNVLILGGTTEATSLSRLLEGDARFEAVLSLAGRTAAPARQVLPTRTGGFGGVDGLQRHLADAAVAAVIDATHPFAAQMSVHAVAACEAAGVPLASLVRPGWSEQPGDVWHQVPDTAHAARALGDAPRHVFLGIGRQDLRAFADAPQHRYLARVIDLPEGAALPPRLKLLQARGPFDADAEVALLRDNAIEVVVSKNSGGIATYAKIEAARRLGLPVVMIARPHKPAGHVVASAAAAVDWLDHVRRSLRGV